MNVTVDTKEYISNLKQLLQEGHEVVITIAGWSMEPFLRNGRDQVLLKKPAQPPIPGDIVFYQRKTGQYVLHRIHKKAQDEYYLLGDRQVELEGPLEEDVIFAVVTEVKRGRRWISAEAPLWKAAGSLWRKMYPIRKLAFAAKRAIRK